MVRMAEQVSDKPVEKVKDAAQQAAKQEVTSRPKREYRTYLFWIGLIAAVGAFTTLTILVKTTPSFPIDLQVTRALQTVRVPGFSSFMHLISWPGFSPQCYLLSALVVAAIYAFGFHWEAVAALFATMLPPLVNVIIKEYIRRPRPTIDLVDVFNILDSYSFPSGHVMFYVGFYGFLWFLAYTLLKRSWRRTVILWFLGIFIALVGMSRTYLGQHWASDVLGAYLLGSLTLLGILWFYRWGKKRFFIRQPVAAGKPKSTTGA
jgi:membrane-associated phospholipid phosphatase